MSTGGIPGGVPPLASSFAGSQVRSADELTRKSDGAQADLAIKAKSFAAQVLGDVSESGESADRDADGRADYAAPSTTQGPHQSQPAQSVPRADDAFGERGSSLDLDG